MKDSFLIFLLFISFSGYSQKKIKNRTKIKPSAVKVDWVKGTKAHRCKETKLYNVKQRNGFYPFNHASKIELVAFEDIDNYRDNYIPDTTFFDNGKYRTSSPSFQILTFSSKYRNKNSIKKIR